MAYPSWNCSDMTAGVFRELAEQKKKGIPSKVFEALYDYVPKYKDELPLKAGDIVTLTLRETGEPGWFYGKRNTGEFGFFPETYVKHIGDEAVKINASEIDALSLEECEIGRGRYTNVYRVRYKDMNVALKQIRSTSANNSMKQIEELKHEAVIIKQLQHPNIIGIYGICLEKPYLGLLLELCEGQSLKSVLRLPSAAEEIDLRTISIFASQIADAMAFLAQHNYIHGDLKSENVLVKEVPCKCDSDSPAGSVLGVRTIDQATGICSRCTKSGFNHLTMKIINVGNPKQLGRICSTEAYLAPEAYKHQKYSEASDVWSFGVVLWEMLTKKTPYEEQTEFIAFRVASEILKLEIADPPKRYNELMQSCWDRDPLKRPTFSKLLADFRQYQTSLDDVQIYKEENDRMRALQPRVNTLRSDNDGKGEEIIALYEQLFATLDLANISLAEDEDTTDLQKKNERKHISKDDIGNPSDLQKGVSVQMEQGPEKGFTIIVGDPLTSSGTPLFDTNLRQQKDSQGSCSKDDLPTRSPPSFTVRSNSTNRFARWMTKSEAKRSMPATQSCGDPGYAHKGGKSDGNVTKCIGVASVIRPTPCPSSTSHAVMDSINQPGSRIRSPDKDEAHSTSPQPQGDVNKADDNGAPFGFVLVDQESGNEKTIIRISDPSDC